MNTRHSQDKLAWGGGLLSPHTEVPEELCFDLSGLIAVSIKMFFRNIMWAGQGLGESQEAPSCSQLCIASSVDAEGVRDSEVELFGRFNTGSQASIKTVFLSKSDEYIALR